MSHASPILIANSIPKSGTYLLQSLLSALTGFQESKYHLQDGRCYTTEKDKYYRSVFLRDFREIIDEASPGDVFAAHIQSSSANHAYFSEHADRVKHLLIYRHPLDILVSNTLFYSKSETMKRDYFSAKVRRFYLDAFGNDADRMLEILRSNPTFNYYLMYLGWMTDPHVLAVRFEDLYRALTEDLSAEVLKKICRQIGIEDSSVDWELISRKMLGTGITASGAKKKIGQYLDHFDQRHWNTLLDTDFLDIIAKFGYSYEGWSPKISIFCAGTGAQRMLKEFIAPDGIHRLYDNDSQRWGSSLSGIEIASPSEIRIEDEEHFLICSIHYEAVASQLFEMGIPDDRIHFWRGIHRHW